MTPNDDIDEQQHDHLDSRSWMRYCTSLPCARNQDAGYFADARSCSSSTPSPQHKKLHLSDRPSRFKQVTFNAKAWRTSHPVRRDHHPAPELPHWAFPRFLITCHEPGDIIDVGSNCGRGHGCLYAQTSCVTWVCARTDLVPSVAVSLEARIALCTTVEFVGLVEVEWRKMEMPIGMVLAQTL